MGKRNAFNGWKLLFKNELCEYFILQLSDNSMDIYKMVYLCVGGKGKEQFKVYNGD